jgi:hypothetical protein
MERKVDIKDTDATSGAALEEDKDAFKEMGSTSN